MMERLCSVVSLEFVITNWREISESEEKKNRESVATCRVRHYA